MKELRMHGKGGQGIVVGGETLSNAFLNIGKYLAVMPSYGVERRGSDVTAFGRLSDEPVRENCMCYEPNYLVIFDPSQISKPATYKGFAPGGVIIACGTDPEAVLAMGVKPAKLVMIDGIKIAYEVTGNNLTNMIMCGAFCRAVPDLPMAALEQAITETLQKGFQKTSLLGAHRGYEEAQVYTYDVEINQEKHQPEWNRKVLACKTPEKPKYEAPWGSYEDNLVTVATGEWKVVRPVVRFDDCIKCGICRTFCPIQCITKNDDGYFVADLDYCKGCGVCAHECPKKVIDMVLESEFKKA